MKPERVKSNLASNRETGGYTTTPVPRCGRLWLVSIATSHARGRKHRLFVWVDPSVCPSNLLDAIARDDDTTFGILHSRFHELWSLRMGTWLGVGNDPRYTPSTTFETFPFPEGLTPDLPASAYADDPRAQAIAAAAAELDRLRQAWLNPPDLVRREPEVVPGYPDRLLPVDDEAAEMLKKRTLTNLYNQRPAWLDDGPRPARRRRRRRLRLGRGLARRPARRRRDPRPPLRPQPGPLTLRAPAAFVATENDYGKTTGNRHQSHRLTPGPGLNNQPYRPQSRCRYIFSPIRQSTGRRTAAGTSRAGGAQAADLDDELAADGGGELAGRRGRP